MIEDLQRLAAYLEPYRKLWRRRERFLWAQVYLAGLLSNIPRKTVEGIARNVALPHGLAANDSRQALHNFIQGSPWDEQPILRLYRRSVFSGQDTTSLLVDNVVLPKQGRHSVGVHRQYWAEVSGKINCQVIPTVFLLSDNGCIPVAMRLYLPRAWEGDTSRLKSCAVPLLCRDYIPKGEVALRLLDGLTAEHLSNRQIVLGEGYHSSGELIEGLTRRGYTIMWGGSTVRVRESVEQLKNRYGLNHFEGRTWRGLHHHLALIMLAYRYQRAPTVDDGSDPPLQAPHRRRNCVTDATHG